MPQKSDASFLHPLDNFVPRHIGPRPADVAEMLRTLRVPSLDVLIDESVPRDIRLPGPLDLPPSRGEQETVAELKEWAGENQLLRSYIGMGYSDCITPPVIQRNILENPSWYTQYTPYQAEISQGRLEALLNYQTMVSDLTGLPLSNASLLDEATAAAEAMALCWGAVRKKVKRFFVSELCHAQTIAVVQARATAIGIDVVVGSHTDIDLDGFCGALVQYPTTHGRVLDYAAFADQIHAAGGLLVVAADLLSLCMLRAPAEFGADVAVGSAQRFGVPMGYGGPHAGYFATLDKYKRQIPGRIIGLSKDAAGNRALRMALQTREQHIRRDKATSNICTAQVLLAIMAGMYAVYHGPQGLLRIAERVNGMARILEKGLAELGYSLAEGDYFDTLIVHLETGEASDIHKRAVELGMNLRPIDAQRVGIALDETTGPAEISQLLSVFDAERGAALDVTELAAGIVPEAKAPHARRSSYLSHPVFNSYHSEHEMLRYIHRLAARDLSLTTSMISLGSCTMKLNATSEMIPVTWPEFSKPHPFVPLDQMRGYAKMIGALESALCEITGFAAMSLQPNAGSQGEYAGMLVIRAWHESRGEGARDICLIPSSAHGTNPASAVMAGMRVVGVACDEQGNIDVEDLRSKAEEYAADLAALMVTYPSTHGVFEEAIREICTIIHDNGGQVYMDGANMNAQVGLCRPGDIGADVCHLNLHKTFAIPHGGGGPGVGPIGVAAHLATFLPGHPVVSCGGEQGIGAIAAAPWGSAGVLPISWLYIAMLGVDGLTQCTRIAILNANYMAERLGEHYPVLFTGARKRVAHEFILDLRPFEKTAGVVAEDVAKRLMDYGFHAPTMSFPVAGTLMVEPTESESKAELDRFCTAMIAIREEIRAIEEERVDRVDNVLKNAPHTAAHLTAEEWSHPYTREEAAYPAKWLKNHKFWPPVARIDNGYGDRNLICSCPPVDMDAKPESRSAAVPVG